MGTIHGACVSVGTGSGTLTLNPTGTLKIDGGRAQIGKIEQIGGVLNFSSGALGFSGVVATAPMLAIHGMTAPSPARHKIPLATAGPRTIL